MKQPRIPVIYAFFNAYIGRTAAFLWEDDPAHAGHKQYERFGLSVSEATEWKDRNTAWAALWVLYEDPTKKTLSVARQVQAAKKAFALYGRPVVNRIASSPAATEDDATMFNFVLARKKPSRRTTPIAEQVLAGVKRSGSTEFEVQCRFDKDTKRPSLISTADGVEYSYKVVTVQPTDPATIDPEGDGFRQRTIRKARFIFKSGTDNKGKYLLIAFRWSFSPNTALNGPWTEVQVILIS